MSAVPSEARAPPESGLLDHRCVFAREDPLNRGQPPTNGTYRLFSDRMQSIFNLSPEANIEAMRAVGHADARSFWPGPEEHEASFEYYLQRWFVDASGNPLDAMYDGLIRDEDNRLPHTHTVVDRETNHTGGNFGNGTYKYTVGLGGKIDVVSTEGNADDSLPMVWEVEYVFEKVRSYVVHRLDAPSTLLVASDNANDTGQVTIENEDRTIQETFSLNGTTDVLTTNAFDSVDSIWINTDQMGDVTVYKNVGDATTPARGDPVAYIPGRETHNMIEGDQGIPPVGSGSIENQIEADPAAGSFEHFLAARVSRAPTRTVGGLEFGPRLHSVSLEVANNVDSEALAHTRRQALDEGAREVTVGAEIAGPFASHETLTDYMTTSGGDVNVELQGGTLRFPQATVTDPGERGAEAEEASSTVDMELESRATATDPAIVIEF